VRVFVRNTITRADVVLESGASESQASLFSWHRIANAHINPTRAGNHPPGPTLISDAANVFAAVLCLVPFRPLVTRRGSWRGSGPCQRRCPLLSLCSRVGRFPPVTGPVLYRACSCPRYEKTRKGQDHVEHRRKAGRLHPHHQQDHHLTGTGRQAVDETLERRTCGGEDHAPASP